MFEIKTPSRIHMGLIDMNGGFGRLDGSVGLALQDGGISLRAQKADAVTVTERFENGSVQPCSPEFTAQITGLVSSLLPENEGVEFEFLSPARQHIGLGSGTQIALSTAMAVNDLYSLGKSVKELAQITRRGGTSGIGVLAFEHGGFIVDSGHKMTDKNGFLPSSRSTAPPADLLLRLDFPDWDIVVAIPPKVGINGEEEKKFFQSVCPVPIEDVREASHIVLMQMIPSILEQDIESLGNAVNQLQKVGFKKHEVAVQPPDVKSVIDLMLKNGLHGAGISSFGPAVYGFSEDRKHSEELKSALLEKMPAGSEVLITKANNKGAEYHV
ncbi:beta-ribofuranosylaminobenzene 5'-phosphate synthase [Methanimicrococcus blatticola]|uniref:Beta-ribofuranosylaminobenzene 5'-phosphate synthase n=1 Tax=Methanimicrococcus blatticola TaxID=91560 RepID=A0A484F4M7_9EURY|nr:beta-ribofuranosylaminobenzene 5'-phosphate synthase [Methanimicrococcus blatticola]MBZ3936198.1 beta-ribofuranosylaminobenzene 5'-phosphate synthase [Methanimicrococcus blatticola]MCC2508441.1 beta-ribofuranosylaminobenzene 5'-phosphate synthase [Methanimicrococcus blatticola]TDQ70106.1 beta-ribofuranosylaminobenzene 5'-phosphate synthase [Methanimicrococcus blatticola]